MTQYGSQLALLGSGKMTLVRRLFKSGKGVARKATAEDGVATDTASMAAVEFDIMTR